MARHSFASALAALLAAISQCAVSQPSSADDPSGALALDTYTPGPCSPNGQAHGACPQGELVRIRVVPIATGLTNPFHIAFLPNGRDMLVTEGPGRLRIIRAGALDPKPVAGWPVPELRAGTLNSVLVHPQFAQNQYVYLSYVKSREDGKTSIGLARGRLVDAVLSDVHDVFVADAWIMGGPLASRAEFAPDGTIYFSVNDHDALNATSDASVRLLAQDLSTDVGKVLRVRDDGSIPPDNPFVGRAGAKPEIFTYGHRNVTGFAWHPQTGQLWSTEVGPMGGDELNVLLPGRNYGWPLVSLGKIYNSTHVSDEPWWRPGMEMPAMYWMPAISPSGLTFYTGDRFPPWRGHLFLGALNGQMLQRVAFNQPLPQTERRESLLTQLDARVRHVVQGPDGDLYISTEKRPGGVGQPVADNAGSGAILRIEPAD